MRQNPNLMIEINMNPVRQQEEGSMFIKDSYIEFKDNGPGIHPK